MSPVSNTTTHGTSTQNSAAQLSTSTEELASNNNKSMHSSSSTITFHLPHMPQEHPSIPLPPSNLSPNANAAATSIITIHKHNSNNNNNAMTNSTIGYLPSAVLIHTSSKDPLVATVMDGTIVIRPWFENCGVNLDGSFPGSRSQHQIQQMQHQQMHLSNDPVLPPPVFTELVVLVTIKLRTKKESSGRLQYLISNLFKRSTNAPSAHANNIGGGGLPTPPFSEINSPAPTSPAHSHHSTSPSSPQHRESMSLSSNAPSASHTSSSSSSFFTPKSPSRKPVKHKSNPDLSYIFNLAGGGSGGGGGGGSSSENTTHHPSSPPPTSHGPPLASHNPNTSLTWGRKSYANQNRHHRRGLSTDRVTTAFHQDSNNSFLDHRTSSQISSNPSYQSQGPSQDPLSYDQSTEKQKRSSKKSKSTTKLPFKLVSPHSTISLLALSESAYIRFRDLVDRERVRALAGDISEDESDKEAEQGEDDEHVEYDAVLVLGRQGGMGDSGGMGLGVSGVPGEMMGVDEDGDGQYLYGEQLLKKNHQNQQQQRLVSMSGKSISKPGSIRSGRHNPHALSVPDDSTDRISLKESLRSQKINIALGQLGDLEQVEVVRDDDEDDEDEDDDDEDDEDELDSDVESEDEQHAELLEEELRGRTAAATTAIVTSGNTGNVVAHVSRLPPAQTQHAPTDGRKVLKFLKARDESNKYCGGCGVPGPEWVSVEKGSFCGVLVCSGKF
jgi:hypothetical protein